MLDIPTMKRRRRTIKTLSPYQVARLIGFDALKKLCDAYPGGRFNVPKRLTTSEFETSDERDHYIRCLSWGGKSHGEIAALLGLSERRVRDIVNRREKDPAP